MAEKKKSPKVINVEPIQEYRNHNDPGQIDVPGWVFSWQNKQQLDRHGWSKYRPVLRDTELGEEVALQFDITGDQYSGTNANSNFFMQGGDCILSYTSVELRDKAIAADQAAADRAMSAIAGDVSITRHTVIDKGPQRKR